MKDDERGRCKNICVDVFDPKVYKVAPQLKEAVMALKYPRFKSRKFRWNVHPLLNSITAKGLST